MFCFSRLSYRDVVEVVVDDDDDVPILLLPLPLLLLFIEALNLEAESCAALATSLEFCSNVFAAFVLRSNICFVFSFACCIVVLYASRLANI